MNALDESVARILAGQRRTKKPLAIILAGHNGSGKSTMWRKSLADTFQLPLINADRMMLSLLPEPGADRHLIPWAQRLRDNDTSWMKVAQAGVLAFMRQAIGAKAPFAMETVFSHWRETSEGKFESKIDLIEEMQRSGYFVLLFFVGLSNSDLSIARVMTRVDEGGHDVERAKLTSRFPRTQRAVREALKVADASILTDNSRLEAQAFTVCRVQLGPDVDFDIRTETQTTPKVITNWLDVVAPQT